MPVQTKISQLPNFNRAAEYEARAEQARKKQEAIEQRGRQEKAVALWSASSVGDLHASASLEKLTMHKRWCKAWDVADEVIDRRGILVLLGDRGNGKTQLAVELIRKYCKLLYPCLYTRTRQIGMAIRDGYGKPGASEMATVKAYTKPFILVMDEIQERPDTDFELRTMTMMIDMRYESNRPTIMIANATAAEFKKIVGSSVIDRIHDRGSTLVFDWPSFRGAK